eukprot:TRINITY_DN46980_c0_g1_i1.p1 TRINITY_DN46980_c0_g1~~TRINITY_DN46980_c0_g1_i1.p1  ORF type:complete len:807 (+),score=250.21 TRINITY_DN46980_c0_g1_i1:69-2489(+)
MRLRPALVAAALAAADAASAVCGDGWEAAGSGWSASRCYRRSEVKGAWGPELCRPIGGTLAALASVAEVALAAKLLRSDAAAWVGLRFGAAGWAWESGGRLLSGLPAWRGDAPTGATSGACGEIAPNGTVQPAGCSRQLAALCMTDIWPVESLRVSRLSLFGSSPMDYPSSSFAAGKGDFSVALIFQAADPGPREQHVFIDGVVTTVLVGPPAAAAASGAGSWSALVSKGPGMSVVLRDVTASRQFPSMDFTVGDTVCSIPNTEWGRPHHWVFKRWGSNPAYLEIIEDGVSAAQCPITGAATDLTDDSRLRFGAPAQREGRIGLVNGTVSELRVYHTDLSAQQSAMLSASNFVRIGRGICADVAAKPVPGWRLRVVADATACLGLCAARQPCAGATWLPHASECILHAATAPPEDFAASALQVQGKGGVPIKSTLASNAPGDKDAECWANPQPASSGVTPPAGPSDTTRPTWSLAQPGASTCELAGEGWSSIASANECANAAQFLFGLQTPPAVAPAPVSEYGSAACVRTDGGGFALRAAVSGSKCGGGAACVCRRPPLSRRVVVSWSCPESTAVGSEGTNVADTQADTAWAPAAGCPGGPWFVVAFPEPLEVRGFNLLAEGVDAVKVESCSSDRGCVQAGACDLRSLAAAAVTCTFEATVSSHWKLRPIGSSMKVVAVSEIVSHTGAGDPTPAPTAPPDVEAPVDSFAPTPGGSSQLGPILGGIGAGLLLLVTCVLLAARRHIASWMQHRRTSRKPLFPAAGRSWGTQTPPLRGTSTGEVCSPVTAALTPDLTEMTPPKPPSPQE